MYWRLTPEERRIMERTRREGEEAERARRAASAGEPEGGDRGQLWRSVAAWVGGIALLVLFALVMTYLGSRL